MTDDKNQVKVLSPAHCTVAMYGLRRLTHKRIAELTGYSAARVTQILGSPAVKAYQQQLADKQIDAVLSDPVAEVRAELDKLAMPAVQVTAKLMHKSKNERIQLNAANSLLDRTVPRKVQQAPPSAQFVIPDAIADRLLKVLGETAKLEQAIDVTPSEVSIDDTHLDE